MHARDSRTMLVTSHGAVESLATSIALASVFAMGGLGGVSLMSQLIGTVAGIAVALIGGFIVYGLVKAVSGIRLSESIPGTPFIPSIRSSKSLRVRHRRYRKSWPKYMEV